MSKHTPGPWRVDEPTRGGFIIMYGNTPIAVSGMGHGNSKADSQLLAAAPELLAACLKAYKRLSTLSVFDENMALLMGVLQKAINKATGE